MPWKGTFLSRSEFEALERIFPHLVAEGISHLTVNEMIVWLSMHPDFNIDGMKSSQKKRDIASVNPGKTLLDVQNALYHPSASTPKYTIHDSSGAQVTLVRRVGAAEHEIL